MCFDQLGLKGNTKKEEGKIDISSHSGRQARAVIIYSRYRYKYV